MQYRLFHIASLILLGAVLLSGIVNNVISLVCVLGAVISWAAAAQLRKGGIALRMFSVLAWLFLAAVCSLAFRSPIR